MMIDVKKKTPYFVGKWSSVDLHFVYFSFHIVNNCYFPETKLLLQGYEYILLRASATGIVLLTAGCPEASRTV